MWNYVFTAVHNGAAVVYGFHSAVNHALTIIIQYTFAYLQPLVFLKKYLIFM